MERNEFSKLWRLYFPQQFVWNICKDGFSIAFPEAYTRKNPSKFSMHGDLEKWKAVKKY
jgi:hypothetical protein